MNVAEDLQQITEQLEQELGLPKGFFSKLKDEDDWSFVVKLESLIESACTYLLVKATNPALEEIFSRLEIASKSTGKIAFIKSLNLLDEPERAFIRAIAELRNTLVHDVRNVASFSFPKYIEGLDNQQLENLGKTLLRHDETEKLRECLKDGAKILFWFSALSVLANIYIVKLRADLKQRSHEILSEFIDNFGGLRTEMLKQLLKDAT